ncbi:MAG TPA: D-alanine--D-alanine ligase [Planctomycetota bacterium]|nr:D-alanine--D-alanine ligase [Planctomycetota bacterium]
MLVGLTYDLRADYLAMGYGEEETAEFDREGTIDAIERELVALGHRTERVGHVRRLVERLAAGARWDLVFNIAEGLNGFGREAQVPALLDAYGIPYTFCDPLCAAVTLHKAVAKRVLRDSGIPTPDFAVVERPEDAAKVDLPFPLFVKPVAEGTAKGIRAESKVRDRQALEAECARVIEACRQPALVETFLPGREVTVGITGTGEKAVAVATLEVILRPAAEADSYTYKNKEYCEDLCEYVLAKGPFAADAERLALAAWRALGCRDGGRIDLRADAAGKLSVLEANPLPGLHPEHSDLPILCTKAGVPYRELIRRIVASAAERIGR